MREMLTSSTWRFFAKVTKLHELRLIIPLTHVYFYPNFDSRIDIALIAQSSLFRLEIYIRDEIITIIPRRASTYSINLLIMPMAHDCLQ